MRTWNVRSGRPSASTVERAGCGSAPSAAIARRKESERPDHQPAEDRGQRDGQAFGAHATRAPARYDPQIRAQRDGKLARSLDAHARLRAGIGSEEVNAGAFARVREHHAF